MITVISRFRVRNGLEDEVRQAFVNRPHFVDNAVGFRGFDILTDASDPSVFLLLTRWTDENSFRMWHGSDAHHQSHKMIPKGLKLDPAFTSITIGNSVAGASDVRTLEAAIESQPAALSRWLMESDTVFALLVTPEGAIRARNRASHRIFPPDPENESGTTLWQYLVCSDEDSLRQRLLESEGQNNARLLLNLADGQQNPITLEINLIRCSGAILLLGTEEHQHDALFQTEIVQLTNNLSVIMRESTRKNRELQQANETIERMARTDPLTGLSNRRTLSEGLAREIARAQRLGGYLSVIVADLDHFKTINDQYGHLTGDHVLQGVAAVLGSQLRAYDVAARLGGDEFALLLSGIPPGEAVAIAERIRDEVARIDVPGCLIQICMSLGVAGWMTGEAPEEFIARADTALYQAKTAGRNGIATASGARA